MCRTINTSFVSRKLFKNSSQKQIVSRLKQLDTLNQEINGEIQKTIKNIHHLTKTGFDGVAQKKENQDNFFIYKNLNGNIASRYFGVWYNKVLLSDGHGVFGHKVSTFIKQHLPVTLDKKLKNNFKNRSQNDIIQDSFLDINKSLINHKDIDSKYRYYSIIFSGSTCVSLIYTSDKIITANVGDSRAIIGRKENEGKN